MTGFFAIPQEMTRNLAVFLYVLHPFGTHLLKLNNGMCPIIGPISGKISGVWFSDHVDQMGRIIGCHLLGHLGNISPFNSKSPQTSSWVLH
jgi:hypothetical protein